MKIGNRIGKAMLVLSVALLCVFALAVPSFAEGEVAAVYNADGALSANYTTLEEAIEALGVPIYPIESDGFALWDAISGDNLPEVKIPVRSPERQQYYKYNQN